MANFGKLLGGLPSYALRGGIGRNKIGMLALQVLKLSHQLNGIRNQLKAALEVELKDEVGAGVPTNTSHEDLDGWLFSILGNEATFR